MRSVPSVIGPSVGQRGADLLRFAIAGTAVVAIAVGDTTAAIKCVLLLPPALASRFVGVPPIWEFAFNLALAVEAIGSAAAWNGVAGWNTAAHVVIPFLSGPLLYHALWRLGLRSDPEMLGSTPARLAAGIVTFSSVVAIGALWELLEWAVDTWFGTDFAQGYADTMTDLLHDAIAAVASSLVISLGPQLITTDCD